MADTTATKRRLERWASRVFFDAAQAMADKDSRDVPRRDGDLARTRRFQINETAYSASVEYPTDLASWLEDGTRPHFIPASPVLAFDWPKIGARMVVISGPGRLQRFETGGAVVLRNKAGVNHPGSTIHVGWFSSTWNEDTFRLFLEFGAQKVAF